MTDQASVQVVSVHNERPSCKGPHAKAFECTHSSACTLSGDVCTNQSKGVCQRGQHESHSLRHRLTLRSAHREQQHWLAVVATNLLSTALQEGIQF